MNLERILHFILHGIAIFVPALTDCGVEFYEIESESFTWQANSSGIWVASDWLDSEKRLIFRLCSGTEWIPDIVEFVSQCSTKMYDGDVKMCPNNFMASPSKTFCYDTDIIENDRTQCIPGSIFFSDMNADERYELVSNLPVGAQASFKQQGRTRNDRNDCNADEEVELLSTRCGSFGMPLELNIDSIPVDCDDCDDCRELCLSFKASTMENETPSAILTIEDCSTLWKVVIFRPLTTKSACPYGYYRLEYSKIIDDKPYACFAIKMFPEPIPVGELEHMSVVDKYCDGSIMKLRTEDAMLMFMQLSKQMKLSNGNHCLFGLTTGDIISYTDWDQVDILLLPPHNLKWDRTIDYERVTSSYLAVKPNGEWTWATDVVSCIVCMADVAFEVPELMLDYNIFEQKLKLTVTHQEFLFREKSTDLGFNCFAKIGDTYKSKLKIFPVVGSDGNYFIEDVGLGDYWCNGHTVESKTSQIRTTETINAYGMVFAFRVERNCNTTCSYSESDLERFVDAFERKISLFNIFYSALALIEDPQSERQYTFIAHLSLGIKENVVNDLDTNLVSLTNRQMDTAFVYEKVKRVLSDNASNEINILSVTSTEFCLHESTLSLDAIIWRVASIDETISTSTLCPNRTHFFGDLKRHCSIHNIYGTFWKEEVNAEFCYSNASHPLLELYINFNDSNEASEDLKTIIQENIVVLLPIDVFLTSQITRKISNVTLSSLEQITSVYSYLMLIDEYFLLTSASVNSTNVLLEAFDNILLSSYKNFGTENGNVSIHSPLLETFVFEPNLSGISGMSLYRPKNATSDGNFTIYSRRYFYPNETIDDLSSEWDVDNDLVVGSYLPAKMLKDLTDITISINVFFNDKLFQSFQSWHPPEHLPSQSYFVTNGKIISISIFELEQNAKLPSEIPIFFETHNIDKSACGYWSLIFDVWSGDGCFLKPVDDFPQLALCECTHLTHFGCTVDGGMYTIDPRNEHILTIITIVGSSLSLCGTLGIFITAATFQVWRVKLSSQILMHFSASIALEMSLMIITNFESFAYGTYTSCIFMGSMVHYSVLVMFFWMLIIAYFQFKRYVVVFNFTVDHLLLKSTIFGWCTPLVPVIITLAIDHSLYLPVNKDEKNFCYPTGSAFNFGVLAPISLIFAINFIFYLSVLISLYRGLRISTCMSEAAKIKMRLSQIRLLAFLFFTLGLTWIFGFLSRVHPDCYLLFTYLFCLTSTVQGLILFLYFIVLDPYVRSLWIKYFSLTN